MRKTLFLIAALILSLASCKDDDDPAPELSLDKNAISFTFDGTPVGGNTVAVTSNTEWMVTSDREWCTVSPTSGKGNQTLTITAASFDGFTERPAVITVKLKSGSILKTINVTQGGNEYSLFVTPENLAFNPDGTPVDGGTIAVTSNTEWIVTSDKEWCTVSPTNGMGNQTLTITATAFDGFAERPAVITVKLKSGSIFKTINITQEANEHSLSVTPKNLVFNPDGTPTDGNTIAITATTSWEIFYQNDADKGWCKLDKTSGSGSSTLSVNIPTKSSSLRIANLTVKMANKQEELTIIQHGSENVFDDMTDPTFKFYCEQFDSNTDGVLSYAEAQAVTSIDVDNMNITSLDGIQHFTGLLKLVCSQNQLAKLDVSKNTQLTYLECDYNQITELDLSNNINIAILYCSANQLKAIDVSMLTKLEALSCYRNPLTTPLDLSNNTKLIKLNCHTNQLLSLDLSNNTQLLTVWCHQNQLTSISLGNNPNLLDLRCEKNNLTALDISLNTGLQGLICNNNPDLGTIYVWDSFDLDNPSNSITATKDAHTIFKKK